MARMWARSWTKDLENRQIQGIITVDFSFGEPFTSFKQSQYFPVVYDTKVLLFFYEFDSLLVSPNSIKAKFKILL